MSFGGYGGAEDPFGADPFGSSSSPGYGSIAPGYGPPPTGRPPGHGPTAEVNTLATLSVVFAFVFAPVGVVLGHLALSQIKRWPHPGRRRAVVGLTLSYAVIALAVIALVIWLVLGASNGNAGLTTNNTTVTSALAPSTRSTVITPRPRTRPTVRVEDLRVGDCVEIQQNQPDPDTPGANEVAVYRVPCEIRDGVFQVRQIVMNEKQCPRFFLYNEERTIFACTVKYGQ